MASETTVDYKYQGSTYEIRTLNSCKNFIGCDCTEIDKILLMRKKQDKYWGLVYIRLLRLRQDENSLKISKDLILIDLDNSNSVMEMKLNANTETIKICEKYLENDDEGVFRCNTESNIGCEKMLSYYYQWFIGKKVTDELNKFKDPLP